MEPTIYHLRITLRGTKPPIWRRVAVPSDITLGELHDVIQIVMGWTDSHLHGFTLEDESLKRSPREKAQLLRESKLDEYFAALRPMRIFAAATDPFGEPMEMDGEDETAVTLAEVCPAVKCKLQYDYDFGDDWRHTVEVQKIQAAEPDATYPHCLAGKRACPPEDCGGVYGYEHLLAVLADPKHPEHDEMLDWLGDEFDPEHFDLDEVNDMLTVWRKAHAKRKLRLRRGES